MFGTVFGAAFVTTGRWTVKQLPNLPTQVSISTWGPFRRGLFPEDSNGAGTRGAAWLSVALIDPRVPLPDDDSFYTSTSCAKVAQPRYAGGHAGENDEEVRIAVAK